MSGYEHDVYYIEIVASDVEEACTLYSKACGWSFGDAVPELGGARVATLPEGTLCGIRASMHEMEKPIVRTYLRVKDLATAVQDAAKLGAEILLESMEIPGRGTIAVYKIGGIEQGLWQLP